MTDLKLNVVAPINTVSYGLVSTNILGKFYELEYKNISLFPINQKLTLDPSLQKYNDGIYEYIKNADFYDKRAPSIRIWHEFALYPQVGKGIHIGFPIFEKNRFNKDGRDFHHLNNIERLFVPTEWAKQVIISSGISTPVEVVNFGVDTSIFNNINVNNSSDCFTILNVGKIEKRKGHDILCNIFNKAFKSTDNVKLFMSVDNPFMSEQEHIDFIKQCKTSPLGEKIFFINRLNSQWELAELMKKVDIGFFPSRAEGWNLPAMEMLACGKYVVITNYSAHTEFCNEKNSKLIDITEMESGIDNKWFFGDFEWAKIGEKEEEQAISHLRDLFKIKKEKPELLINSEGIETAKSFSWEKCVMTICDKLV